MGFGEQELLDVYRSMRTIRSFEEICDGNDNDCDGTADEGYLPTATSCGDGVCASTGTLSCVSGSEIDSCVEGPQTGPDTGRS